MTRRSLLAGAGAALGWARRARGAARPNLVLLLTDDQRHDTIAALGHPDLRTPALDSLVQDGVACTRTYLEGSTQGAVCVCSRACLLTGRGLFRAAADLADPAQPLLPEVLRDAGYQTHVIGKWHNGAASLGRAFSSGERLFLGGMGDHQALPLAPFDPSGRFAAATRRAEPGFASDLFADSAVRFLRQPPADRPFFLYVAFTTPHDPRTPPDDLRAAYDPAALTLPPNLLPEHPFDNGALRIRDELLAPFPRTPAVIRTELASYYAMITAVDRAIGRVLEALREAGRERDTIVVFAGDNGLAVGQHGLLGKQSLYEHSLRVPLVWRGPDLPRGARRAALACLHDVYPTLADLLGLPLPAAVDGCSLRAVLQDAGAPGRATLGAAYGQTQRLASDGRWKLLRYPRVGQTQLFDLAADPWEQFNLAGDARHGQQISRLTAVLQAWQRAAGDPLAA
ncbi:MAG: sulfatase-like hydrolase/transferase [Fimbriimonadaceae bacterium]|nr:sulfatase-like hydrolase/transferase [Fimbriimonadaceae bacterium]